MPPTHVYFASQSVLPSVLITYTIQTQSVGVKFMKTWLQEIVEKIQVLFVNDTDNRVCRYLHVVIFFVHY